MTQPSLLRAGEAKILAAICFAVVYTWKLRGPASVVRIIEDAQMCIAAAKILHELKLSGLYGFDTRRWPMPTPECPGATDASRAPFAHVY
jgi:hypothetical protein